jgi:hypothetical protein
VRLEELGHMKNAMTSSGNDPATFRIAELPRAPTVLVNHVYLAITTLAVSVVFEITDLKNPDRMRLFLGRIVLYKLLCRLNAVRIQLCSSNIRCNEPWEVPVQATRRLALKLSRLQRTEPVVTLRTLRTESEQRTSHRVPWNLLVWRSRESTEREAFRATAAYPFSFSSTTRMASNSGNEQPLMLHRYVTCISKQPHPQTGYECNYNSTQMVTRGGKR